MKTSELFEVKQADHDNAQRQITALRDDLVKTFGLADTGSDISIYGTHAGVYFARFELALKPTMAGDDLEFTKEMMMRHVPVIARKYFPDLELQSAKFNRKREYYAIFDVPPKLRRKIDGWVTARGPEKKYRR